MSQQLYFSLVTFVLLDRMQLTPVLGPPFSGKTKHFQSNYAPRGFERRSLSEFFERHPDAGMGAFNASLLAVSTLYK